MQTLGSIFGGVLDSIFLSVALADRINVIKNEKTEMQLNNLKNLGNLAIQVGDFINTPLQVISLNVEELKEETDPEALKRGLEDIQKQVDAITLKNQTLKKYHQYSTQDKLLKGEEAIPAELL